MLVVVVVAAICLIPRAQSAREKLVKLAPFDVVKCVGRSCDPKRLRLTVNANRKGNRATAELTPTPPIQSSGATLSSTTASASTGSGAWLHSVQYARVTNFHGPC